MLVFVRHNTEIELRIVYCRLRLRRVDLVLQLAPFWVVDAINPLLGLDDNASELGHLRVLTRDVLLACLDADGPLRVVASVQLNALLVGSDIKLDAGFGRGQRKEDYILGFGGGVSRTVHDEGVVVAGAIEATAVERFQDVLANLLGRGEVVGCASGSEKLPGGNLDVVDANVACSVGHV